MLLHWCGHYRMKASLTALQLSMRELMTADRNCVLQCTTLLKRAMSSTSGMRTLSSMPGVDEHMAPTMDKKVFFSNLLRQNLINYPQASNLAFNDKVVAMKKAGKTVYHFAFGQSPFPVPDCLIKSLQENAHKNEYVNAAGVPELRIAICNFHKKYDNLDLDPNHILISPGSKELIYLTLAVFNGDIILSSPAWSSYEPQCILTGHKSVVIDTRPEDGWKITPQSIEAAVNSLGKDSNKLLVFNNPGNPSGAAYTKEELKNISAVCRKNNILVLSDEIYARLHHTFDHTSISHFYPEGTILTSGFSKWASAGGWRVGYCAFPPTLGKLHDAVSSAGSNTYTCSSVPVQYALAQAMQNEDELDNYMRAEVKVLSAVSKYSYRELREVGVGGVPSCAAYYYMADFEVCREGLRKRGITQGEQVMDAMLGEANVALMFGSSFLHPANALTARFCFVNFDGQLVLHHLNHQGLNQPITDDFIEKHCTPLVEGIKKLKDWVTQQLS